MKMRNHILRLVSVFFLVLVLGGVRDNDGFFR